VGRLPPRLAARRRTQLAHLPLQLHDLAERPLELVLQVRRLVVVAPPDSQLLLRLLQPPLKLDGAVGAAEAVAEGVGLCSDGAQLGLVVWKRER
jgi:hypothetical protein